RVDRGTLGTPVLYRVRMHGDEKVRLVAARDCDPLAMLDVVIAIANQYRFHTGFLVVTEGEILGTRERHVLLEGLVAADGPWIAPAVAGVDCNDDVASRAETFGRALDRMQAALALQVDDQPVAVLAVRSRRKAARADSFVQVQNDAQLPVGPQAAANAIKRPGPLRVCVDAVGQPAVFQVHHEPVRPAQGEDVVICRAAQVEHDPRPSVLGPDTDIFDRCCVRHAHREQQRDGKKETSRFHWDCCATSPILLVVMVSDYVWTKYTNTGGKTNVCLSLLCR